MIELYEKMSSLEHAVVKESGLTPAQMHPIEILGHQESLRMKELAQKLSVTEDEAKQLYTFMEKLVSFL